MKLYPDAALRFADESTSCRTRSSRSATLQQLRQLQAAHPKLDLNEFRTSHLTEFCLAPGISPGTTRSRRSKLMSFFDWCAYMRLVKTNPATDLKFTVRVRPQSVRTHNWLTEPEIAHVLRSCEDDLKGQRDRCILLCGFLLGLRRDEIAGLRWSNFSTDLSRITLIGKGRKLATLGVPPQLRSELQAWRRTQPLGNQVIWCWFTTDRDPIWDKAISDHAVYVAIKQAGERAGIPDLAPHDLRRSFAGVLESKGVAVTDISRMMRHSNVGITSTYLEQNPSKVAALGDAFVIDL